MEIDINEKFIADCEEEAKCRALRRPYPEERRETTPGEEIIREAEASRVRIFTTSGKGDLLIGSVEHRPPVVDENYLVVGNHVDVNTQEKKKNGEYIDFARLVSKDRIGSDDDHRMELVIRGGQTYFVPVSEREVSGISNFNK